MDQRGITSLHDQKGLANDNSDCRIYIGNLDHRITESNIIKMFSPFGKIVSEDFLWHTRGAKRGEPRGYAFVQYTTKEEAQQAKEKMNGRLACGRPLVVRLASEKHFAESSTPLQAASDAKRPSISYSKVGQISRSAKISAIKTKLKSLEEEGYSTKRPKLQTDSITYDHEDLSTRR